MKNDHYQAARVAVISMVTSVVLSSTAMLSLLEISTGFWIGLCISAFVPLVVAYPVSLNIFRQKKHVMKLHEELEIAHKQLQAMSAKLRHKASIDGMTGLLNRENFLEVLDMRNRKSDDGMFLLVDIDRFKTINDTYGHPAGDRALLQVVSVMQDAVRGEDTIGRLGGEEFGVFLPRTNLALGRLISERLRLAVENMEFTAKDGQVHPISISIGMTHAARDDELPDLMARADTALYKAKRSGRNRVVVDRSTASDAEYALEG